MEHRWTDRKTRHHNYQIIKQWALKSNEVRGAIFGNSLRI